MPKLNIPYRSQWDNDAGEHSTDCGPTCLAMMLNYHQINMTPDAVYNYEHLRSKGPKEFTNFTDLAKVARANELKTDFIYYDSRATAFQKLRANIDAGKPMLVLVNYAPWETIIGNKYGGAHFVVISGYDDANIYMHDPLFGLWVSRNKGSHYAMSNDLFSAGWGGCSSTGNLNWTSLTMNRKDAVSTPPPPPPKVDPKIETAVSTPLTDDTERRIRALAAYRWTEGPNFNSAADVKLWQDHLGDFASEYQNYVVKPGNSLSMLASQFYNEQGRWPVIKAFNGLQREGLWAGETLEIPNIGKSGAGQDPALPSNTLDKAKAFSMDDLVDPDARAADYNDFAGNSAGISVYEEN